MVLASYLDNSARLWDVTSGQLLRLMRGKDTINSSPAAFSPDAKWLVLDEGKTWWDVASGEESNYSGKMIGTDPLFSPDGTLFITKSGFEKDVLVWNVSRQDQINRFSGHTDRVLSMAISPDNRLLLTGSADKTVRLWDIANGRLLRVFSGHTAGVTSVAFTPDGKRIVTGSLDGTIRTWITDYNDLLDYACSRIGIDLGPEERTLYGITDDEPTCPQFGVQSLPPVPTTTPMPTRTPQPQWTSILTPTPARGATP